MKTIILVIAILTYTTAACQEGFAQIEQIHVDVQAQDGILLVSTFGEPVVGVDVNKDAALIHGFYPVALFEGPVSVKNINPIPGLEAFPNPTQDKLVLSYTESNYSQFHVTLNDARGRLLKTDDWTSSSSVYELSLSDVAHGMYVITISDPATGRTSHLQVVKQ